MNETELKGMIESILGELVKAKGLDSVEPAKRTEEVNKLGDSVGSNIISNEILPDISEVDLKKQLLVDNPHDREDYLKMKSYTAARLGVGRCGTRYKTQSVLRFRADHAAAQDAVFSDVNPELVEEMGFIPVRTVCKNKDEYITRPDHGRIFDEANTEIIKQNVKKGAKLQVVVGDGLSSAAIEANIRDVIPALKQGLKKYNLDFDKVLFVKYCRVPAMDPIGEISDADVVCLFVGERPGLVTAESMSAYIAYRPTVGMPESRRTVVSNIHKGGTPAVEAGAYIADIIKNMLEKKKSGIELK
ncbi:MAG: ethanolamine ammonia-lyase subunit EutC [Veillonella sp.]|uniref:ethanolamine ammonia-lyase subunit EutC n=1 Tax=Veillonella sp. TaxID=1926307 RepID=UPI0025FFAAED|nr:ethanolamine ammonia-lyase subunit EutC [Veillonella sp.]MBE6080959.1 ethanolamine ammonia-lyase subunit EutC [Veillonella sp.]